MENSFENRCKSLVEALGICRANQVTSITRLTGGVASDIATVTYGEQIVCVKFALSKLKVNEDWFAPVHRNKAEYAWLEFAQKISPATTPKLFGWSEEENGFAMEFISGAETYLWKNALLAEKPTHGEANSVAAAIGQIHSVSARSDFDRDKFDNSGDFESLRIEPYLRFTATQYPELETNILAVANELSNATIALVHGDVSPKNILIRNGNPILLDAECATIGDPCFDVTFCLNHLLLKAIHLPRSRDAYLAEAQTFWTTYNTFIDWEKPEEFEVRIATLLPILMLARVDGKSPVEYLSEESKTAVRGISQPLIKNPVTNLSTVFTAIIQGTQS